MTNAVIIDDEPNNVAVIRNLLQQHCPDIKVMGTANDAQAGYELIIREKPALVFLDIEMPFGNAFDLLERIRPVTFEIIFITAFSEYAIKAFKYGAIDYLLKPVNVDDLVEAVRRSQKRIGERNVHTQLDSLYELFRNGQHARRIALPTGNGLLFEQPESIVKLEADGAYTHVYISGGKKETVTKTLKDFETMLPEGTFYRLHHSYIVNLNYIKRYYKGRGGYVELLDGSTVEVSSRRKDDFLEKFR